MQAFVIHNLTAECRYGYRVILHLPNARISNQALQTNLIVYSVEDPQSPNDKIMNLVDGETSEGWLNFYLFRFANDDCYVFGFGLNRDKKTSEWCFAGNFQGYAVNELTKKMNITVEEYASQFQRLYTNQNPEGITNLVKKVIHAIR